MIALRTVSRPDDSAPLAGPPLSIERLRHNAMRAPDVMWRGVGLTAFVGSFSADGNRLAGANRAEPVLLTAPEAIERESSSESGSRGFASEALAAYLSSGRTAVALDENREAFSRTNADYDAPRASDWIGDDAGPGRRTGVFQLVDLQDVSTIALVGSSSPARRERLLRLAAERRDKYFVFIEPPEASDGRAPELIIDRANTATLRVAGGAGEIAGQFLARVESTDLDSAAVSGDGAVRRYAEESFLVRGIPWASVTAIRAWRRIEGLRRSIELGTRWVVLEPHHPLVWRRVERQVRAFLFRMAECGVVREPRRRGGFAVACRPRIEGSVAAVDVSVRVELPPPFDIDLDGIAPVPTRAPKAAPDESAIESNHRVASPAAAPREESESSSASADLPTDPSRRDRGDDPGGIDRPEFERHGDDRTDRNSPKDQTGSPKDQTGSPKDQNGEDGPAESDTPDSTRREPRDRPRRSRSRNSQKRDQKTGKEKR